MRKEKSLKSQQRWTDKKLYPWAIVSLVLTVVQHMFSLELIGVGFKFDLYITWIPLGLGLLVLTLTRRKYLLQRSAETEGTRWKTLLWIFMLMQGVLFSYTSFGLVARTTADILNRLEVQEGLVNYEQYPIHEAHMKGRRTRYYRLAFIRESRREVVRPGFVKEMADQRWDPPFDIVLRTTPGILGTSILMDYSWIRVEPVGRTKRE